MATFKQYQERLQVLGTEAKRIRHDMESVKGETKKILGAQYSRLITQINQTVLAIYAEHPKRCWHDKSSEYRAVIAQWREAKDLALQSTS